METQFLNIKTVFCMLEIFLLIYSQGVISPRYAVIPSQIQRVFRFHKY